MKSPLKRLKINLGLFFSGLIVVTSGLLIQINFHIGNRGITDLHQAVWRLNQTEWSLIHKIAAIIFTFFVVYHILLHRKWFKAVISKNLIAKNKLTIALSLVFLIVAFSGYSSWFITAITVNDIPLNHHLVGIHDRIGLLLIILFIMHIRKRLKWFISSFGKLKSNFSVRDVCNQ